MPKIIGLTGGIGSGKTTVANYFAALGVPVYIADEAAKKITNAPEILKQIKAIFGLSVFDNNILNRKKLSLIVFNDAFKLKQLNAIIHPAVKKDFDLWIAKHADCKIIIKESAILFETGGHKLCDHVVLVIAPLATRIERVMSRDNLAYNEVMIRINNQWTDKQRIELSDFIINNDILENTLKETKLIFDKLIALNP